MTLNVEPIFETEQYPTIEDKHLEMLLFIRATKNILLYSNSKDTLETVFNNIDTDTLHELGYRKNKQDFEKLLNRVARLNDEHILNLAMTTCGDDLKDIEELNFLKVVGVK